MKFDYKTATQLANFFAIKEGGEIDKLKLMKLAWLVDRYHLRRYWRPVLKDKYFAMDHGPVPSSLKNVVDHNREHVSADFDYVSSFIGLNGRKIVSKKDVDYKRFSETDLEAMEEIYKVFWGVSTYRLRNLSHLFPEWANHWETLSEKSKGGRVLMDYMDFFDNPASDPFFSEDENVLNASKQVFLEDSEVGKLLELA